MHSSTSDSVQMCLGTHIGLHTQSMAMKNLIAGWGATRTAGPAGGAAGGSSANVLEQVREAKKARAAGGRVPLGGRTLGLSRDHGYPVGRCHNHQFLVELFSGRWL